MKYPYGKIDRLSEALEAKGISEFIIATILQDGEKINNSTDAQAKAQWLKGAMQRLAEQVPGSRIQRIRGKSSGIRQEKLLQQ